MFLKITKSKIITEGFKELNEDTKIFIFRIYYMEQ